MLSIALHKIALRFVKIWDPSSVQMQNAKGFLYEHVRSNNRGLAVSPCIRMTVDHSTSDCHIIVPSICMHKNTRLYLLR